MATPEPRASARTTTTMNRSADTAGHLTGWRRFTPPNRKGKFPWRKRWLGLLPLAALGCVCGWMSWTGMEDGLEERAVAHLACEGIDADELELDWSYRDVTVEGQLPVGVTAAQVERIIDGGSDDADCLRSAGVGIDPDADPGVYDVNVAGLLAAPIAAAVPDADPEPTATPEQAPTATPEAEPTATPEPEPTATPDPEPTATPEPEPTATPEPEPTATPEPTPEPDAPLVSVNAQSDFDGQTITLFGFVGSDAQRQALVDAAIAAVGADNVIDELQIDPSMDSASNDALIEGLADVTSRFGRDLITGLATASGDALSWDLIAIDAATAAGLDLAGTGVIDAPTPVTPEFTG